jgi:hypothetical protein
VCWVPKLEDRKMPPFAGYEQTVDLADGSIVAGFFASRPKDAFLRARLATDQGGRVGYFRLVINDYDLARRDEQQAAEARRASEREAFEQRKSPRPKF